MGTINRLVMISQPQMTLTQLLFGADISSTRRRSLAHLSVHGRVVHHFFMGKSRKLKHGFDAITALGHLLHEWWTRAQHVNIWYAVGRTCSPCLLFSFLVSSLQPSTPYKISQVVVLIIIIYYSNNIFIIIYGSIYIAQNHAHLGPCTN